MRNLQTCLLLLFLILCAHPVVAQQMADPEFKVHVERPAYKKDYPRVMFDEAHNNFHTTTGRYKPFVDLIISDGYHVVRNRNPFTKSSLQTFKVLVISNALGAEEDDEAGADNTAFSVEEIQAVYDWVKNGGALLLIADHAPFGGAASEMAKRFGVEMSKGYAHSPKQADGESTSVLVYSRENGSLMDHPITRGRSDDEKINRVVTFTGQALKNSEASAAFLRLAEDAFDKPSREAETSVPVGGWAQGLAFKLGKGRVVMLGEAAMLSAQLAGANKVPIGMNAPGNDNRQLALNIMRWLTGVIK